MKPPPFQYCAPNTITEVLGVLARSPEETSLLAGGQSLLPLLNMRLARPTLLVDLNQVPGLDLVESSDGMLVLGAMVRHRTLETSSVVRARQPLLSEAAGLIAHLAIRTRGTVGGSLAHADPAAELPTAMSALRATLVLVGLGGERRLSAERFFLGAFTTAITPGELLARVEVPALPAGTGWSFQEVTRVHGAFALVGAAAVVHLDPDGRCDLARLALCGLGGAPHLPLWLEEMLIGEPPQDQLFTEVERRIRQEVQPWADVHASAEYRREVSGTLAARSLRMAFQRAAEASSARH